MSEQTLTQFLNEHQTTSISDATHVGLNALYHVDDMDLSTLVACLRASNVRGETHQLSELQPETGYLRVDVRMTQKTPVRAYTNDNVRRLVLMYRRACALHGARDSDAICVYLLEHKFIAGHQDGFRLVFKATFPVAVQRAIHKLVNLNIGDAFDTTNPATINVHGSTVAPWPVVGSSLPWRPLLRITSSYTATYESVVPVTGPTCDLETLLVYSDGIPFGYIGHHDYICNANEYDNYCDYSITDAYETLHLHQANDNGDTSLDIQTIYKVYICAAISALSLVLIITTA